MSTTKIVIDRLENWSPYYPSQFVCTFEEYFKDEEDEDPRVRVRIINLCSSYSYLSDGYYCSLLAEARGHSVIPSIRTINDARDGFSTEFLLKDMRDRLVKLSIPAEENTFIHELICFGDVNNEQLKPLGRIVFRLYPCPILKIILKFEGGRWCLFKITPFSYVDLNDEQQTFFANALDSYSQKIWQKKRSPKTSRFDLALLVDSEESLPPSNAQAIKRFIKAGKALGVDVEVITSQDEHRLSEFDGLFIRTTTSIDHYTYRMAMKAESLGLVTIDDTASILRCTNKIYLADLFRTNKISAPKSFLLHRGNPNHLEKAIAKIGFPMVVKIPDGSFSRGIVKVNNIEELHFNSSELFAQSALLLVQEFVQTDYDWRIGVLGNRPIFACRYYMVKNHWQIYHHGAGKTKSGNFDCLPTFEVPKNVIKTSLQATKLIGDGLYGVDVKEVNGKGVVIEINDNPNIDAGIEDSYLGTDLYITVMDEFVRRMENLRK